MLCKFESVPDPNSNETRRWRSMAVTPELLHTPSSIQTHTSFLFRPRIWNWGCFLFFDYLPLWGPFVTHDLIECAACHESEWASSGERQIKRWRATEQAAECDGLLAAEQAALSRWSRSPRERDGNPWNKWQRVWREIAKIIDAVQAVTGKVSRLSDRVGYKSFPFFCTNRGMKLLFKLIFFLAKIRFLLSKFL